MPRRLAFALSLLLALAAAPWPALAHAILVDSQPRQGSSIDAGEITLRLRFNSRIDAARSRLALALADGKELVLPIAHGERDDLLIAPATLAPGPQVLRWQVLAVDGHITRGELRFTVRQAAT
ncbi:MAG: copper resistance protein CopC [Alphaproteobacteria bacterium]|nr:copper resistance protein CopC [Alphaproteobacteria bacterium]